MADFQVSFFRLSESSYVHRLRSLIHSEQNGFCPSHYVHINLPAERLKKRRTEGGHTLDFLARQLVHAALVFLLGGSAVLPCVGLGASRCLGRIKGSGSMIPTEWGVGMWQLGGDLLLEAQSR